MDKLDLNTKNIVEKTKSMEITSKQKQADLQKIKKVCKDFESIFTYQLLKTMRQTVPKSSGYGSMSGKETYNMIIDQKVAEELSDKGNGLGLQKILFEQLTKHYTKEVSEEKIK